MTIHPIVAQEPRRLKVDGLPFVDASEAEQYFRRVHATLTHSPVYTVESAEAYLRNRLDQIRAAAAL